LREEKEGYCKGEEMEGVFFCLLIWEEKGVYYQN
jgi:hypothetical protein